MAFIIYHNDTYINRRVSNSIIKKMTLRYYGTNIEVPKLPEWHIKLLTDYDRIYFEQQNNQKL